MSTADSRKRIRGIRASRVKLNHALAEADFKTQSALAERIADREGLDSAPKDLVNRVFREKPVEPLSLERVALALGVQAHTLYLSSAGMAPVGASPDNASTPSRKRRLLTPWRIAAGAVAAVFLLGGAVWNLPDNTPLGCGVREFIHPVRAARGRLGIVIARFANDPGNTAQYFLANNFINDSRLDPYVSVLTTCRVLSLDGSGDMGLERAAVRKAGRDLLERSGARILIWGRVRRNRILVRFVSARQGTEPVTMQIGQRPVQVEEPRLQMPLSLDQPAASLPDIETMALKLMSLYTPAQAHMQAQAMRSYHTSIDWLRAAIVSAGNLRRSIDPRLDPRRWAAVNAELCYNNRLLGDYDADAREYRAAETACKEVLEARPKAQYPLDWAQAKVNLASVYIRLHLFATSREGSEKLLRRAESALLAANALVQRVLAPQLWAVVQRNLGMVYVRLAELKSGAESGQLFKRGITLTKASLDVQQPAIQPLDWAITQQNICLAQHELGERRGKTGIDLVRRAISHCREALRWLSPEQSALDWAMAQNNLAISEAVLSQMQADKPNLESAIKAFRQAQTVYTKENLPVNWAMVEANLGELYCHLAKFGDDRLTFKPAIAHASQALEVFMVKKVAAYQRYVEGQLSSFKACRVGNSDRCVCGSN